MLTWDLSKVFFASVGSIVVLFLLTKMLGYKQMSELSMFDYVNSISIGSIAAEMATTIDGDFMKPLLAMVIYAVAAFLIGFISNRSLKFRRFFEGRAIILFQSGKIYKKNLARARIDLSELLAQCRVQGYFDLNDISLAIMESNGKISILPSTAAKPVSVEDLKADELITNKKQPARACANVIMDGAVRYENLKQTGNNDIWLKNELGKQGISSPKEVFLATVDDNNKLNVYVKIDDEPKNDLFQ
ncbi:MAG: DUF421 domain-containing protein [Clostridiales bacterium]|nr:DUF421 domain-containing protein [Clostridiales bacterium]